MPMTNIQQHDALCKIAIWAVSAADIALDAIEVKFDVSAEEARRNLEHLAELGLLTFSQKRKEYRPFTDNPRRMQQLLAEKALTTNAEAVAGATDVEPVDADAPPNVENEDKTKNAPSPPSAINEAQVVTTATKTSEPDNPDAKQPGETSLNKKKKKQSRKDAKVVRLGMNVEPEQAIAEINRLAGSGMQAIGDYLVETFFAGDIANL